MRQNVVSIVRCTPKPGKTEEVLDVLREVAPSIHDEDGCLLYAIHVADDGDIWFVEKWEDLAAVERHATQSPVIPILQARTSPLLEGPPIVINTTAVPIGGAKGAI